MGTILLGMATNGLRESIEKSQDASKLPKQWVRGSDDGESAA
jgi:hypothetical protein